MSDNLAAEYAETLVRSIAERFEALDRAGLECETCEATGISDPEVRAKFKREESVSWGEIFDNQCPDCEGNGTHDEDAAREALDEYPLELVARKGCPFEVVLTVGGPDARVEWDARWGTDNAELVVRWGGDKVTRSSEGIRRLAAYFEDLMDTGEEE